MIGYGKYLVVKLAGREQAIMFSGFVEHEVMANGFQEIIAGGFWFVDKYDSESDDVTIKVFGESVSTNTESREEDAELIEKIINVQYL